jgi:hypothetical protein
MIVEIYNRVSQLTKTGTAGYVDQDEFNGIIAAKQLSLLEMLIDVEGENKKAADLIAWLKKVSLSNSDANGVVTLPDDYIHIDTMSLVVGTSKYPVNEIDTDQVEMLRTSPILYPDLANNEVSYYWENGTPIMFPETNIATRMRYYAIPPEALIVLTETGDSGGDYLTATAGTELGWPQSAYNLLVYLTLMDYGIELKQQEIFELAQYGITIEMIKNAPQ